MDRITTIQVSSSTRDRLYRLKFRKTYDEYLVFLMDMYERLEAEGGKRARAPDKILAMSEAMRGWVKRNMKWRNGRISEVDLDGR
jgi:hypothetical protein